MRRKRLTNKQKDKITVATIMALLALVIYLAAVGINYAIKILIAVIGG